MNEHERVLRELVAAVDAGLHPDGQVRLSPQLQTARALLAQGKYTPGPWTVVHEGGCVVVGAARRIATIARYSTHLEESLANAQLIAAAPQLLETAQAVVREDRAGQLAESSIDELEAVIKEATE